MMMMRKRNSFPTFDAECTNEKSKRKTALETDLSSSERMETEAKRGNGEAGDDDEMINVVDVSDSEEKMDAVDASQSTSSSSVDCAQNTPGPSVVVDASTTASAGTSLPLDLSKKKRRLTASTSLTEDDNKDDGVYNSDSDHRQRKGIAGFSGTRGGSFGAGGSSSSSSSSSIKWRRPPLECETPSRGESPSVIVGGMNDIPPNLQSKQHPFVNRNVGEPWQVQQLPMRPSVIRSADFSFEPPESTDVDEHFRKSLSGGGQVTTEADAKVDDHFARALGDVWWALKNRMHLTPTGEEWSGSRSSPSPASLSSSVVSNNCAVSSNATTTSTSPTSNAHSDQASVNEILAKAATCSTFPSSTPLKKRILSKAAEEAAAQRMELNIISRSSEVTNNNGSGQDEYSDQINNNSQNGNSSDEDSRKSLSAPSTPPPTPL